jgi:excisionase family DNA binding protein
MRTDISNAGRPAYYTVREAAWILGVKSSTVSRAIRLGTLRAVRRHGRLVVPARVLIRLLGVALCEPDRHALYPNHQAPRTARESARLSGGAPW